MKTLKQIKIFSQIEAILEILNQTEEHAYYPPDVYASRDSLEALNDD